MEGNEIWACFLYCTGFMPPTGGRIRAASNIKAKGSDRKSFTILESCRNWHSAAVVVKAVDHGMPFVHNMSLDSANHEPFESSSGSRKPNCSFRHSQRIRQSKPFHLIAPCPTSLLLQSLNISTAHAQKIEQTRSSLCTEVVF